MSEEQKNYEMDREEDEELTDIISEEDIKDLNILYKQNTFSVKNLLDLIEEKDILIPSFQRSKVWNTNDKIEFIESILMDVPIPSMYLAEKQEKSKYLIIDGQQRTNALNEFILKEDFKLKSVIKDWNNKYFSDLSDKYQKKIRRTFINVISIMYDSTNPFMLFHIFARINKGGIKLSHQQIRNSIYVSKPLKEIREISTKIQTIKKYKKKLKTWEKKATLDEMIIRILLNYLKLNYLKLNYEKDLFINKIDAEKIVKQKSLVKQLNRFCYFLQQKIHDDESKTKIMKERINKIYEIFNNESLNFEKKFSPFPLENLISFILFEKIKLFSIKQNFISKLFEKIDEESKEDKDNPFYNNTNTEIKVIKRYDFIKKIWENENQK